MILSESEKNRIRALHREASVIKEPLNEWSLGKVVDGVIEKSGLEGYLKGKEGFIPDNVQKKVGELIKKLSPTEQEELKKDKSKLSNYLSKDYLAGKEGLIPGDQTELKKKATNIAKSFMKGLTGFIPKSDNNKDPDGIRVDGGKTQIKESKYTVHDGQDMNEVEDRVGMTRTLSKTIKDYHAQLTQALDDDLEGKLDKAKLDAIKIRIESHGDELLQYILDRLNEGGLG